MLLDKQAVVTSLEDAEQKYHDWKSALQQILGETEIQKISDVHISSTNHPDPMRSQYIATILVSGCRTFVSQGKQKDNAL